MMKKVSRYLPFMIFALVCTLVLGVAGSALAQEAAPAAAAATTAVGKKESTSVLQAFFIVYETGENGEKHLEWIGCLLIWFLILASFICTSLMIMFFLQARKPVIMPEATREGVKELLAQKKFKEAIELVEVDSSYFGRLTYAALKDAPHGFSVMERSLEEAAAAQLARKCRPYEVLNIVGNVGPMLGLFGTVHGMIMSFFKLVSSGGNADPTALAAGISTALVATFWGMIVAIPALVAYATLKNLTEHNCADVLHEVDGIIGQFRPAKKKPEPAPVAPAAPARASRPE